MTPVRRDIVSGLTTSDVVYTGCHPVGPLPISSGSSILCGARSKSTTAPARTGLLHMNLANGSTSEGIARSSTPTTGSSAHRSGKRQPKSSGARGWNDVWDSSSDAEESVNARPAFERSSHSQTTVKPALHHASSTPIPVPSAKGSKTTVVQSDGKEDRPPARSSSYTDISAPSPSSYGPRDDWTVLDTSEITEAEKVYEAGRNTRMQQAGTATSTFDSTSSGSSSALKSKTGPVGGSTRSFGSGVAGLSKSFINIALGTSSGASATGNGAIGKGKGKEAATPIQEGPGGPARRRVHGRDAIRPDIDEILRGGSFADLKTHG